MVQRRTLYLTALAGGLVFYWAYREWLAGFLLMLVLVLPWMSLLLTLPAALTGHLRLQYPQAAILGTEAQLSWHMEGFLPPPPLRSKLRCRLGFSGKNKRIPSGGRLPTDHCGMLELRPALVWGCDYLGILRFPVKKTGQIRIPVRPRPVKPEKEPDLSRFYSGAMAPKSGGGFGENHELRLYRPGDSLRQIHWKLSAKTGQLILREPMEIKNGRALVSLVLSGNPEELDDKLGRLLWMMEYLVDKGIPHRVACCTGEGVKLWEVATEPQILETLDAVLACAPAPKGEEPVYPRALWRYHIGGDSHGA